MRKLYHHLKYVYSIYQKKFYCPLEIFLVELIAFGIILVAFVFFSCSAGYRLIVCLQPGYYEKYMEMYAEQTESIIQSISEDQTCMQIEGATEDFEIITNSLFESKSSILDEAIKSEKTAVISYIEVNSSPAVISCLIDGNELINFNIVEKCFVKINLKNFLTTVLFTSIVIIVCIAYHFASLHVIINSKRYPKLLRVFVRESELKLEEWPEEWRPEEWTKPKSGKQLKRMQRNAERWKYLRPDDGEDEPEKR